ncbi:succinylglutamate desuccinylase/aspartoacylase family protein [Oligoflexaceae bacterium]|nr:succinylglutamate desuccinylase/aspartoacylase family protein [Oligoflexaceae bacterium]
MDGVNKAFQYIDDFDPNDLLDLPVTSLCERFGGPVILRIDGEKKPPLLLSTLLHGNEWTGYHAIQQFIRQHNSSKLPRETFLLLGNVEAAAANARFLEGQSDFNRIWDKDSEALWSPVLESIDFKHLFACVDMHNNSGKSPHYAIVSKHDPVHYQLAKLFGSKMIHLEQPAAALSIYLSQYLPAITLESGLSDELDGLKQTSQFLKRLYSLEKISQTPPEEIELYETLASMHVPEGCRFGFSEEDDLDIKFQAGVSKLNFSNCPKGTVLAKSAKLHSLELRPCQKDQADLDGLLHFEGPNICLSESLVPSMLTENTDAIKKDCFGYLMRRIK